MQECMLWKQARSCSRPTPVSTYLQDGYKNIYQPPYPTLASPPTIPKGGSPWLWWNEKSSASSFLVFILEALVRGSTQVCCGTRATSTLMRVISSGVLFSPLRKSRNALHHRPFTKRPPLQWSASRPLNPGRVPTEAPCVSVGHV